MQLSHWFIPKYYYKAHEPYADLSHPKVVNKNSIPINIASPFQLSLVKVNKLREGKMGDLIRNEKMEYVRIRNIYLIKLYF